MTKDNKIAIALIHGIGKLCPGFAEKMIRNIKIELGSLADDCVFEPIHWAPLAQEWDVVCKLWT